MDSSFPLVSVIIPCYNAERYVSEAIASALDQTYPQVEVIVVDDGSTDRSIEMIQSFGDRVQLAIGNHQGACAARNRGLQMSKGAFIQFLDADDVLLPNKLEIQVPVLQSGQADLVFCNGYLFGDDRPCRPIKKLLGLASPQDSDQDDSFLYCLSYGFGTESPLHRREMLERVGGFRENLKGAQETDLHIRLGISGARLHKLDAFLFKHRNHDDPTRITKTQKPPGFMLDLLLGLLDFIEQEFSSEFTQIRRNALASRIFQSSIYAYREGAEELARTGFQQARRISTELNYQERSLYKFLANYLNPIILETALKQARNGRSLVQKRFSLTPHS
jgi:glycosyltransferase involved in cell wall biosynthesis